MLKRMLSYSFYICFIFLLSSCVTITKKYEKNNVIVIDSIDTNKFSFITSLRYQKRTALNYEKVLTIALNDIAKKGYHDVFVLPKVIEYKEISPNTNSYNTYGQRTTHATAFDAFNAVSDSINSVLSSVMQYYYCIDLYIYQLTSQTAVFQIDNNPKLKKSEKQTSSLQKNLKLIKKKAEQGNSEAQFSLGLMYDNGDGVITDKKQAVYWYTKASEQNVMAQYLLGIMYYSGDGVLTDKKQAAYWIKKAYENGLEIAKEFWDENELWKY